MHRSQHRIFEGCALLLILALAGYLRLSNLRTNPGWFTDEATHLDIARHMLTGQVRYLAVENSTLYFAKLPLFDTLLAGAIRLFGYDMGTLRALTGSLGTLTVLLTWLTARHLGDHRAAFALFAAFLLAIYPDAVRYSRLGFSYNLLAPLILLLLLTMKKYAHTKRRLWLELAALAFGIGTITDLMAFAFLLPCVVIVAAIRPRDALWSLPLAGLPFACYTALMLYSVPDTFVSDLHYTLERISGTPLNQQLWNAADTMTILITGDAWILCGLLGILLIRPRRESWVLAGFLLLPLLTLARTMPLYSLSRYYLIPLFPLFAIGAAGLIVFGYPALHAYVVDALTALLRTQIPIHRIMAHAVTLILIIVPLWIILDGDIRQSQTRWPTVIDPYLIDPVDADRVTAYVNAQTQPGDVVVGSATVLWQIDAHGVDFPMSAATIHNNTVDWGAGDSLSLARFHHDPRFTAAQFVIVDNLWRAWGIDNAPGTANMLAIVETWPVVFESGTITVYCNPHR